MNMLQTLTFYLFQKVYHEFEKRVLEGSLEYYSKDGEKLLEDFFVKQHSFIAYIKNVQNRINDEIKRAKLLYKTTQKALMQVCYDTLIEKRLDIFDTEFRVRIKLSGMIAECINYHYQFTPIDFTK